VLTGTECGYGRAEHAGGGRGDVEQDRRIRCVTDAPCRQEQLSGTLGIDRGAPMILAGNTGILLALFSRSGAREGGGHHSHVLIRRHWAATDRIRRTLSAT